MRRVRNFLYNVDRAIASLVLGSPPQETISSEAGRYRRSNTWARWTSAGLDWLQQDHVEKAIDHATRLDAADDGQEK